MRRGGRSSPSGAKLLGGDARRLRCTAGVTSAAKLYITVYGSGSNDPAVAADTATAYEAGVGRDPTSPYALTGDNTAFGGASGGTLTMGSVDGPVGGAQF